MQVTLAEMTGPHYSVVTLNSTDRDAGENARVTYSMLPVEGFYINPQTGGWKYDLNFIYLCRYVTKYIYVIIVTVNYYS